MTSYAGSFLVARHTLRDPNFRQSVVLLLAHNDEGAYGVVVNRPLDLTELPFPVYLGGPCESPGLILIHGHAEWQKGLKTKGSEAASTSHLIADGIFVGNGQCLKKATEAGDEDEVRFRIFRNYAGWGPGQLEEELASGSWTISKASADLLFGVPDDDLWFQLAPSSIPDPSLN